MSIGSAAPAAQASPRSRASRVSKHGPALLLRMTLLKLPSMTSGVPSSPAASLARKSMFVVQVFNGLQLGILLLLIAAGLMLVFGVDRLTAWISERSSASSKRAVVSSPAGIFDAKVAAVTELPTQYGLRAGKHRHDADFEFLCVRCSEESGVR